MLEKILENCVHRANNNSNYRFTRENITVEEIEKYAELPVFLLNALNYRTILRAFKHFTAEPVMLNEAGETIEVLLEKVTQQARNAMVDELSYWLVELSADDFGRFFLKLAHDAEEKDIDLNVSVDPKILNFVKQYRKFSDEGIFTKSELVQRLFALSRQCENSELP